jgi:hypothetical protein
MRHSHPIQQQGYNRFRSSEVAALAEYDRDEVRFGEHRDTGLGRLTKRGQSLEFDLRLRFLSISSLGWKPRWLNNCLKLLLNGEPNEGSKERIDKVCQ